MRGGGEGSAVTETVSATLGVSTHRRPIGGLHDDLVIVVLHQAALEARLDAGLLEIAQQILRLVLEAQDAHLRADLHVGERNAREAGAGDYRMTVWAGRGVADRGQHFLLEHRRHRVLQALGLLVDLVPRHPEHVRQEALDQAVATHDSLGVLERRSR